MTAFEIGHGEQSVWQRRAAAELAAILQAHLDLPVIAWTVGSAGSRLVGRVDGFASPGQVRAAFEVWRAALRLTEYGEVTSRDGTVYLQAAAYRNRVQVGVAARVFDDEDEG